MNGGWDCGFNATGCVTYQKKETNVTSYRLFSSIVKLRTLLDLVLSVKRITYDRSVLFWRRAGFWSAMASNLSNQSRNVLSKKVMVKSEVINIFQMHMFLIFLPLVFDLWNNCLVCHTTFCCCYFFSFYF